MKHLLIGLLLLPYMHLNVFAEYDFKFRQYDFGTLMYEYETMLAEEYWEAEDMKAFKARLSF